MSWRNVLAFRALPREGPRMRWCSAFVVGLAALAVAPGAADDKGKIDLRKLPPAAPGVVDFQRDIQPLLARACISCHGPGKQRAGLRLDERAAAMQGSNSGAVIHPGDVAKSRLL